MNVKQFLDPSKTSYPPLTETTHAFFKWLLIGLFTGVITGFAGAVFHFSLEKAQELRLTTPWLPYLMPVAGLVTIFMYKTWAPDSRGTNMVLSAIRANEHMNWKLAPLIFISTTLTHLTGGSAGREGAALKMGGSIGDQLGKWLRLDEKDNRVIVMCGASAAFAALFGTPATAAIFSIEVVSVGVMYFSAIVPCTVASVTGFLIAKWLGIPPTTFGLELVPAFELGSLLGVLLLGILIAVLSIAFCFGVHETAHLFTRFFPDRYLRIFVGGSVVVLLTLLVGSRDYNGAGMDVIIQALGGQALPYAFLLKLVFTSVTLGTGYRGGEIVPVFFIGSTFGCVAAGFLGLPPAFGAALGLVALFCGVTNCPITSIILSVELFGSQGLIYFALICAVSFMLSGNYSLYSEQKIIYSKVKAEYIDARAH